MVFQSFVVALLGALVVRGFAPWIVRLYRRRVLRRKGIGERRVARRRLNQSILRSIERRRPLRSGMSRARRRSLLASFSLDVHGHQTVRGTALLAQLAADPADVYLLDGDSGQGKTTLALALTAQRPARRAGQLLPTYFDAADVGFEHRLSEWLLALRRSGGHGKDGLRDRPLVIVDGVNERLSPERLASILAHHRDELRVLRAQVVVSFGYRRNGYAGELIGRLIEAGLRDLRSVQLQPVPRVLGSDASSELLPFTPSTGDWGGVDGLCNFMGTYSARYPDWALTRGEIRRVLDWALAARRPDEPLAELASRTPDPATLAARHFLPEQNPETFKAVLWLGELAFVLLGRELDVLQLQDLVDDESPLETLLTTTEKATQELRGVLADQIFFDSKESELFIKDETALRLLAAVYMADAIHHDQVETTLKPLRGTTTYDVAAPYLRAAASWHPEAPSRETVAARIQRHLIQESPKDGATEPRKDAATGLVPYSFYGQVLREARSPSSNDDPDVDGRAASVAVETELYRSIIRKIDGDRTLTCRAAILRAARADNLPHPNPVLDQLFVLVSEPSGTAVEPLLGVLTDDRPAEAGHSSALVKSQAAYLLLAWLQRTLVSDPTTRAPSVADLANRIKQSIQPHHGNLHLRFHQMQLVQALKPTAGPERTELQGIARAISAARASGPEEAPSRTYERLEDVVSRQIDYVLGTVDPLPPRSQLVDDIALSWKEPAFVRSPSFRESEDYLECWEVALGLSAQAFRESKAAPTALSGPIVRALTHELWIIRWWAFTNLEGLLRNAVKRRLDVTAAGFAETLVERLFATGEPIGLKQQQCARTEALLAELPGDDPAAAHLRTALKRAYDEHIGNDRGRRFTDAYTKTLGQPADRYVAEYLRRIDRLRVLTV